MTITVDVSTRKAAILAPAVLAMGEARAVIVSGLGTPDAATLKLAVYGLDGALLAMCATFAEDAGIRWNGTVDTRTANAVKLFAGKKPNARAPVFVAMADSSGLLFTAEIEMANNPLYGATPAPTPATVFLTANMFAGIPPLTPESTAAERGAALRAILERLSP